MTIWIVIGEKSIIETDFRVDGFGGFYSVKGAFCFNATRIRATLRVVEIVDVNLYDIA